MPQYTYRNPETGETKDIVQRMTEPHVYSENGVEWQRVFTVPQAAIDTQIDPLNSKDFVEKTKKKKGNVGNLWDEAKEASQKREKLMGKDPIKEDFYKNYSKKRKGKEHQEVQQKRTQEEFKNKGIQIEF